MALLANKKALITGSSRGIGKAIAQRFLEEGCEVWGLSTKPSAAAQELDEIAKTNGTKFHEITGNVGDADNIRDVISEAIKESGGFDILVNNAGITKDGLSFRMKKEDWDAVIAINLTGTFLVTQLVSSDMIRKRTGSIINLSSIVGLHGQGGQVNYSASKAGIIGLTKSLAKETGSRGVRVNAIAPGFVETDMTAVLPEETKKTWMETIPLKRGGTPKEIADTALFLASDMASYITGQVIGVDGGMGC